MTRRLGMEVPALIQHRRGRQRLPDPLRDASRGAPRQIEPQRAIHGIHVFVIPWMSFGAHAIK
jgi:hypothetical protein